MYYCMQPSQGAGMGQEFTFEWVVGEYFSNQNATPDKDGDKNRMSTDPKIISNSLRDIKYFSFHFCSIFSGSSVFRVWHGF